MNFIPLYLIGASAIFAFMLVLWGISLALKNSSIVDIFWGFGFVLSAWLYFFITPQGFLLRKILILVLVTIWGLRLTIHILMRNSEGRSLNIEKTGESIGPRFMRLNEKSGGEEVWS